MSREIKFRAWDDVLLRYLEPLTIKQIAKGSFSGTNWYQLTLEQFTGLHDKNGVEIYENDVIRIKIPNVICGMGCVSDEKSVVIFKNGCFGVEWGYRKEFSIFDSFIKETEFEVIGNIHEGSEDNDK